MGVITGKALDCSEWEGTYKAGAGKSCKAT